MTEEAYSKVINASQEDFDIALKLTHPSDRFMSKLCLSENILFMGMVLARSTDSHEEVGPLIDKAMEFRKSHKIAKMGGDDPVAVQHNEWLCDLERLKSGYTKKGEDAILEAEEEMEGPYEDAEELFDDLEIEETTEDG